jgi:tRNA threonylcarbamoyladenosine biosynthesis protein TsaB
LRIGLAFAKGLALAHSLKLVGVPTMDVVAESQPEMEIPLVSVIPAGRERIAALWYKWSRNKWQADGELTNLTIKELVSRLGESSYICGELTTKQRESLRKEQLVQLAPPSACVRRPAVLAEMAWDMLRRKRVKKFAEITPIYLETK